LIRSDFVATEPEKFTHHALISFMPKPSVISLVPTAIKPPAISRKNRHCFWKLRSQLQHSEFDRSGPELCRRSLVTEKTENDADGFFQRQRYRCRPWRPAAQSTRPYFAPSPTGRLIGRLPENDLERLRSEIQATHPIGVILIRRVLQQCKTQSRFTLSCRAAFSLFSPERRKKV
jgi:hypothetical protein